MSAMGGSHLFDRKQSRMEMAARKYESPLKGYFGEEHENVDGTLESN